MSLLPTAVVGLVLLLAAGSASAQETAEPHAASGVRVARIFGRRHVEEVALELTLPDGAPNPSALTELSILARPHDVDRPTEEAVRAHADDEHWVAEGILRLDAGLATRVTRIAEAFPGHRIEIVSGFRPRARRGSRHRHGRALDLQVDGVAKERVTEVARALPATGVGYYPNSHFTHIDVRDSAYYWVDRSGPGQRADYGTWPPPSDEVARTRDEVFASVRAALGAFDDAAIAAGASAEAPTPAPTPTPTTLPPPAVDADMGDGDQTPATTFADFRHAPVRAAASASAFDEAPAPDEDADVERMSDEEYQRLRDEIIGTLRSLAGK